MAEQIVTDEVDRPTSNYGRWAATLTALREAHAKGRAIRIAPRDEAFKFANAIRTARSSVLDGLRLYEKRDGDAVIFWLGPKKPPPLVSDDGVS